MLVSTTFVAHGGEQYLTLGGFYRNIEIKWLPKTAPPSKDYEIIYYFFDDVCLAEMTTKNKCECPQFQKKNIINEHVKSDTTEIIPLYEINKIVTLQNIFFDTDKSELLPNSFEELDKLVQYLKDNSETIIEISGHTDNIGNEEHNKKLSEARAKAVADYLASNGIDKTRITYNGYGSSKPIATNDTDADRQENRRVEFIINKK